MLLLAKNIKLHPYICLIDQKKNDFLSSNAIS